MSGRASEDFGHNTFLIYSSKSQFKVSDRCGDLRRPTPVQAVSEPSEFLVCLKLDLLGQ